MATAALLVSCKTKTCRCYLLERWGSVRITEVYVKESRTCSDLGYDQMHSEDSTYRYCCDPDLPILDTIDIVRMFWD